MAEAPRDVSQERPEVTSHVKPLPPDHLKERRLMTRLLTALPLIALVIICYNLGTLAFFVLATTVVMLAAFELFDSLGRAGRRPITIFGIACILGMLLAAYGRREDLLAVALAVALNGSFLLALRPDRGRSPMSDVAWTVLGVAWIGGGGAGAVSILVFEPEGMLMLIGFVAVSALGDTGAYLVGTNAGYHKLAPTISPVKSWEGFAGGVAMSLAAGALLAGVLFDLRLIDGIAIGAICGLLGPVGDLVESMAKREIGVKDFGRILPGHGGFLDRLDAILFCAPAVFLYLHFVVGK
ncbi:MAG TPA: phosphatidate cytidylyltransferase [Actinomycetota bacterium]|nr:phosphatidate cytidylyltransferase [Actinomycetota bacterium]